MACYKKSEVTKVLSFASVCLSWLGGMCPCLCLIDSSWQAASVTL